MRPTRTEILRELECLPLIELEGMLREVRRIWNLRLRESEVEPFKPGERVVHALKPERGGTVKVQLEALHGVSPPAVWVLWDGEHLATSERPVYLRRLQEVAG